jgi:molybdate transport system substrate-binding protein
MIQIDYNRFEMATFSRRRLAALIAAAACAAAGRASAQAPLRVAAASDLQVALPEIARQFERDTGQAVALTFGSSGNLATQIENGAPFDVFLSADIDYPRRLERAGVAERGSLYEYATGRLALWTRRDSGVDVSRGLAVLAEPRVRRIAIANPAHAPYGRAALAALRHEHLDAQVRSKLVLGENISQAAQFAHSGNADVGLIALSLAIGPTLKDAGSYVEIPAAFHPPIEQAAVVVAASKRKALAASFVAALKQPPTIERLRAHGFTAPGGDR